MFFHMLRGWGEGGWGGVVGDFKGILKFQKHMFFVSFRGGVGWLEVVRGFQVITQVTKTYCFHTFLGDWGLPGFTKVPKTNVFHTFRGWVGGSG